METNLPFQQILKPPNFQILNHYSALSLPAHTTFFLPYF